MGLLAGSGPPKYLQMLSKHTEFSLMTAHQKIKTTDKQEKPAMITEQLFAEPAQLLQSKPAEGDEGEMTVIEKRIAE